MLTLKEAAILAAKALDSKKAVNLMLLEVKSVTALTEYMLLATGTSDTHLRALCDEVERRLVEEMRRLEDRVLPRDMDYLSIHGLRMEARQKLQDIRPRNLGQASRVSGVSPADVAVLMIYLKQAENATH